MPFVTFEGIDGSGKTTQAGLLARWLMQQGYRVLETKEPDGGRLGKPIRKILVDPEFAGKLSTIEELLLISAARCDHVGNHIIPALADGTWVICDRFIDSTFSFQVFETGVSEELFKAVTDAVTGGVTPDLTFILDLPPQIGQKRRLDRGDTAVVDPSEEHRDFDRIGRGLQEMAHRQPQRCKLIDASHEREVIASQIQELVMNSGLLDKV